MFTQYAVSATLIALVVLIHYEFLHQFTVLMPRLRIRHRYRIVFGVYAALFAHIVEVWTFGIAYKLMHDAPGWGELGGDFNDTLLDAVYFSFTAFTTLGLGDIVPTGPIRFLTGLEALTGFVLITWTASFLYLEMTRLWDTD